MEPNGFERLKKYFENSLSKLIDDVGYGSFKVTSLREAIAALKKAKNLLQDPYSDRNEINRLIADAMTLADNAGIFDERFNQIQTQIQRGGYKASKAGEKN